MISVTEGNKLAKIIAVFIIASVSVLLFYIFFTKDIWEDFFITFRYSQNLIEGNGLVYNIGERVYGFTSPISVLLLAACYYISAKTSYLLSLWLFRVVSIIFFTAAGTLLLSVLFNKHKGQILPVVFFAVFYLFEAKSVLFSINGMETAFMLFFLAWLIYLSYRGLSQNLVASGICWAGLLWTRPDSCIYIVAFCAASAVFTERPKKEILIAFLKISAVCVFLYMPWFIWTWGYYGSPIPNTIKAKLLLMQPYDIGYFLRVGLLAYKDIFGPVYYHNFEGWPGWIEIFFFGLWLFAFFYWVIPLKDRLGRMISFANFLMYPYFIFIPRFPWYFPPIAMLSLFVVVNGLFTLSRQTRAKIFRKKVFMSIVLTLVSLEMFFIFTMTAVQMRAQQKEIEDGNRKQIGLWLKKNSAPKEKVYLEPIGYIGYFSQARISDYPGLVSLDMSRIKNKKSDFCSSIKEINPDWVILRPDEAKSMYAFPSFKQNYNLEKIFNVSGRLNSYNSVFGMGYLSCDSTFLIFKKK